VDESTLTPAQREARLQARRDARAAKQRARKAKKKALIEAAKKRKREEGAAAGAAGASQQGRSVKPKPAAPVTGGAASAAAASPSAGAPAKPAVAASFGLASVLGNKALRNSTLAEQSKPMLSSALSGTAAAPPPGTSGAVAASSSTASAAGASTTAAPAASTAVPNAPSAGMTLEQWRALSASRPELSMSVIGEDITAARLAAKRAAIEANRLTGLGGGYKEADGWKCQSYNCNGHVNFKNDTQCKRCGAARRY